ncbi:PHA/PHB synthase family protein [Legionella gresilensis]|uniref:PHA/PHB synthase family protein n=1 Tax=Legionella gresilensis TaxID=91823 RepID=UPI0010410A02|nr:alpha/beta fold hydrolase [Legionella gresilensis]
MSEQSKTGCPKEIILTQQQNVSEDLDSYSGVSSDTSNLDHFFLLLNQLFQANLAKWTAGLSPAALASAYSTWLWQLAQSPGLLGELASYPLFHANDCINNILCVERAAGGKDVRFKEENWEHFPWRLFAEGFLQVEDWWQRATHVPGLSKQEERTVSFWARQCLDALSPSNFVWSNPDLFYQTVNTRGLNIFRGSQIAFEDWLERLSGAPPEGSEHFIPGKQVAITPGRIVFQNHLIELIQYEAQTKTVYKEPILILPAWIMKYYILDLSPHNSLVRWLVEQGHTVFIISWRNPDHEDRDLGIDDYYRQGAMAAIDKVSSIFPKIKINLMGYCLGGTLAMITASVMAKNNDKRLNSLTLLAAQGDFTEAGELMLFVTGSQVAFLKNVMWEQGYLDTKQMAGSFQMLRAYDLIWSKMIQDYMHGQKRGMIDLTAWNADATRMPYKMHSEYLEKLFLKNDFAEGRFAVEGEPIAAANIQSPIFAVSTEKDHVAPWQSVYKIHLMTESDVTFVLASGGHNAGIISEPGHPKSSYYVYEHKKGDYHFNPTQWLKVAKKRDISWWQEWHQWLVKHDTKKRTSPPIIDCSLPAAPGTYVLQK